MSSIESTVKEQVDLAISYCQCMASTFAILHGIVVLVLCNKDTSLSFR